MKSFLSFGFLLIMVSHCSGQVVQLPAVGSFGVNTTVSVPDQGTASLGGVGRSSYGTTTRGGGPLTGSARGGISSANAASISVTVIDLAAMDEALLNMPAESQNIPNYPTPNQGTKIVNTLTPHHYDRTIKQHPATPHASDWMVALGSRGNDHYDSAENKVRDGSNIRFFLEKAADAQALGRAAAARVYYQMAIERMTPAQLKRFEEIRANRSADANQSKKSKNASKTTAAAATTPAAPAASGDSAASPFDAPPGDDSAKTDMNSQPF